ncbi:adenylate cyclase [Nocardioides scoriae]|uniref:Adenylate cyclase n=1 Tax=Nocardioides scoriae TaxID=642780 RepID=A0A1H1R870_9ACTN|nr:adenylate/guanylate cyclase domain-containing protein [Nocardioides scoriae]SDS31898.1 adenylate cyclase [Nocardioides scoriae]
MTTPEDLERAILGALPELTGEEISAAAGLTRDQSQRLWRALGFPEAEGAAAFSTADEEALHRVASILREGTVDFETVLRMTRALGQTMDRLAEWEVATMVTMLERTRSDQPRTPETLRVIQTIGPDFEALLRHVWRRHLLAAVARIEHADGLPEEQMAEATVGFADLVSFSALTNRLRDDEIGDLVEVFEGRSHDVVARHRGRVVKTLGDSVLFLAASPAEGVEIAWDIVKVIGGDPRLPDVRVGMVTGSVVMRMGDVYGPAVNLAARLVGVARRNRVITDRHTADALPAERYETRVLPARPVRGFGDLHPVAVRRTRRD